LSPSVTKPVTCENFDELLKEEFRKEQEKIFLEKILRIQRAFRRWSNRRRMLDLLHTLYSRRPARRPTAETAVMTEPMVLPPPTIILPKTLEGLEAMRIKEVKLLQEKN